VTEYLTQTLSQGGRSRSQVEKIARTKNMRTVNSSPLSSRQRFLSMSVSTTHLSHMFYPSSWNSLSQLIKRNVNQKLCQFVSQLRRIRVKLWSGKNVMKLSTHSVMTCWSLNHNRNMITGRNVLDRQILGMMSNEAY